ncbi:MAG: ribonuclease HI family protein [Parcubacteria group bacterium]
MPKTKIYSDACCHVKDAHLPGRTGRGKAACGILIIDEKGNENEMSLYLGEMTVPEAEFNGLIFALEQATAITRYDIEVWMDSELVIKWMKGEYRLKKEHIRPLFDEAKKKEQRFKSVEYFHHTREAVNVKRVDSLAEAEYRKNQGK